MIWLSSTFVQTTYYGFSLQISSGHHLISDSGLGFSSICCCTVISSFIPTSFPILFYYNAPPPTPFSLLLSFPEYLLFFLMKEFN